MSGSLIDRIHDSFDKLHKPSPEELSVAWEAVGATVDEVLPHAGQPGIYPYGRKKVYGTDDIEILVMNWAAGRDCAPHDHGRSFGWINVMAGTVNHTLYTLDQHDLPVLYKKRIEESGSSLFAPRSLIHSMGNPSTDLLLTVHIYAPPISGMRVYDLEKCAACVVSDDCGAWWPDDQRQLLKVIQLRHDSEATAV